MNDGWSLIILQLPWNKSLICDAPVATTPSVGWLQRGLHCPATNMEGANLHRKSWNIYTILNNINTKNLPLPLCVHKGELRFDTSSYPSCAPRLNFNSHKASKITTQPESVESSAGHPTWWISISPHPHFLLINILEIHRPQWLCLNMFGTFSSNDGLLSSSQSQRLFWDSYTNDP